MWRFSHKIWQYSVNFLRTNFDKGRHYSHVQCEMEELGSISRIGWTNRLSAMLSNNSVFHLADMKEIDVLSSE